MNAFLWGEPFDKMIETLGQRRCGPWSTIKRRWRERQRRRRRERMKKNKMCKMKKCPWRWWPFNNIIALTTERDRARYPKTPNKMLFREYFWMNDIPFCRPRGMEVFVVDKSQVLLASMLRRFSLFYILWQISYFDCPGIVIKMIVSL